MKKKLILIVAALLLGAAAGAYFLLPREEKLIRTKCSPGDYFVTNVKDTTRLLKATVVLVLDTENKKILEMVDSRNAEIRDGITTVFRSQDLEVLQATDLTPVKNQIRDVVNRVMETEHVVEVLFSDWALQ